MKRMTLNNNFFWVKEAFVVLVVNTGKKGVSSLFPTLQRPYDRVGFHPVWLSGLTLVFLCY